MDASLVLLDLILQFFARFRILLQHAQLGRGYQMLVFDEESDHFAIELTNIHVTIAIVVVKSILFVLFFVIKVVIGLVLRFFGQLSQHVDRKRLVSFNGLEIVDNEDSR